jgi:hypothetical protein
VKEEYLERSVNEAVEGGSAEDIEKLIRNAYNITDKVPSGFEAGYDYHCRRCKRRGTLLPKVPDVRAAVVVAGQADPPGPPVERSVEPPVEPPVEGSRRG